jgi:radical SAM protein with 4Fe4S-binding SPASM domain
MSRQQIAWTPFRNISLTMGDLKLVKEGWQPPNWFLIDPDTQARTGPLDFAACREVVRGLDIEQERLEHITAIAHFESLKDEVRLRFSKEARPATGIRGFMLSPGNHCSAGCAYCYAKPRFKRSPSAQTDRSILHKTFEFIRTHRVDQKDCAITIGGGGDAVENFDFYLAALELSQQYQLRYGIVVPVHIATLDPYFLQEEHIEIVSRHQEWITLSVDGDPSLAYHRHRVDYPRLLRLYGSQCKWAASAVFTSKTAPFIAHNYEYLAGAGFSAIQMRPARLSSDHPLHLKPADFEVAIAGYRELLERLSVQGRMVDFFAKLTSADYLGRYFLRYLLEMGVADRCGAGIESVFVDPAGNLFPCPSTTHQSLRLGDLESEIIQLSVARKMHDKPDECKKCHIFPVCGGPCTHETLLLGGLDALNPSVCQFQRQLCDLVVNSIQRLYEECPSSLTSLLTSFGYQAIGFVEGTFEQRVRPATEAFPDA